MQSLMFSFTITFSTFNLVKAAKTANTPAHSKTSRSIDSIEQNMNAILVQYIVWKIEPCIFSFFCVPT